MKLEPLADFLLIRMHEEPKVRASGLLLPDNRKRENIQRGTVLAVGPGKMNEDGTRQPINIKPGTEVLWHPHAGYEFPHESMDELWRIVRSEDVLARIE